MQTIEKERVSALKEEGLNLMKKKNTDRDKLKNHLESVINKVMSVKSRPCPNLDEFLDILVDSDKRFLEAFVDRFEETKKRANIKTAEDSQSLLYILLGSFYNVYRQILCELTGELDNDDPLKHYTKNLSNEDSVKHFLLNLQDLALIPNKNELVDFLNRLIK